MKAKVLIIDHNDSFTYNLVQLLEETNKAIVTVINYDNCDEAKVSLYNGIILSPGPGTTEEYNRSIQMIKKWGGMVPILGVCMGFQLIVSYFGGTLEQLPTVDHGKECELIRTKESLLFNGINFPTKVGLYHSWMANRSSFPKNLTLTSQLKDGRIMSFEHKNLPIHAVQFHPESYITTQGNKMILNWVEFCIEFNSK